MAHKRMFSMDIVDSDAFLTMPASSQLLYYHLGMRADDDGFIGNARSIQRMVGAADGDMKMLFEKRFIIMFESGVVVVKHWRIHNTIRKDRYTPTSYRDERSLIRIKENRAYTDDILSGNQMATTGKPSVPIGEESIEEKKGDFSKEKEDANTKSIESIREHLSKKGILPTR